MSSGGHPGPSATGKRVAPVTVQWPASVSVVVSVRLCLYVWFLVSQGFGVAVRRVCAFVPWCLRATACRIVAVSWNGPLLNSSPGVRTRAGK